MSERIQNILSFIDQHDDSESSAPVSTNNESNNETNETEDIPSTTSTTVPTTVPTTTSTTSSTDSSPTSILDSFLDNKQYNAFVRKMKSKKGYPFIMNNQVFNNESEALAFKNDILNTRREHRKIVKQNKIQNSKMNFEAMPTVDEDKDLEYYEQDGMLYKIPKSPYAVVKDGVKRVIPKTSNKETKAIATVIKKQGGKDAMKNLVTSTSEDQFQQVSSDIINASNDETVKNMYHNHVHNDFAPDKTWNQESFLRTMQSMMNEMQSMKESMKPKRLQGGLNPALLRK